MQFRNHLIDTVVNYPKRTLFFSLITTLFFLYPITQITKNFSGRSWLPPQSEQMSNLLEFENKFGSDETLSLQIHNPKGLLNSEDLNYIKKITEELKSVPGISRVNSLTNHQIVKSQNNEIDISPFIPDDTKLTTEAIGKIKTRVTGSDDIEGVFLSKDKTLAIIHGNLIPEIRNKYSHSEIVENSSLILEKVKKPQGTKLNYLGIAYVNSEFQKAAFEDLFFLLPIVSVLVFILLLILFRSFYIAASPFVVVGMTLIVSFGIMGLVGISFTNLTSVVPAIMLGIGFADCIHIIISYVKNIEAGQEKIAALKQALHKNFIPTVLTTLTTSVGFLSLGLADILPIKNLGIISSIGVVIAWFFTYFAFAPLLSITPTFKLHMTQKRIDIFPLVKRFRYLIFTFFFITSVTSVYLATKNKVNNDPIKYFSSKSQVSKDYDLYKSKIGSTRIIQFIAISEKGSSVKNPLFLKKIDRLKQWALSTEHIQSFTSVSDVIKRFNKKFNNDDPLFFKIPEDQGKVANTLFFISMGAPPDAEINSLISQDEESLKITISWSIQDTATSIEKTNEFIAKAKSLDIEVIEGGISTVYNSMNNLIVDVFSKSMFWTIVFIFILMLILLKSLPFAILAMAPNIIPLCMGAAILYLSGLFIEAGSVTIWSICLGIAIDDTIHFLVNFKKHMEETGDAEVAVQKTLNNTGVALFLTSFILIIFFGGFAFVDYIPNRNFGIFSSLIIFLALITDIIFLPAALLIRYKKKKLS